MRFSRRAVEATSIWSMSATTMDTRCHPAPLRRARACPRASEDGVARTRRLCGALAALTITVTCVVRATPVAANEVDDRIDQSLRLCAAADRLPPDDRLPILAHGLAL